MIKDVAVKDHLYVNGIKGTHRPYPTKPIRIFGGDTETVHGEPDTFQMVSQGEEVFERVDEHTIFPRMMAWLSPRLLEEGLNVVFFHHLRFDLTIVFKLQRQAIYNQYNDVRFQLKTPERVWDIRMLYGRVNTAWLKEDLGYWCKGRIRVDGKRVRCGEVPVESLDRREDHWYCTNPEHRDAAGRRVYPEVKKKFGLKVMFMDSSSFCPPGAKSLEAALKIYGVPYKKMNAPEGLGQRKLFTDYFKEYAMNDSRAEEALGQAIFALHKEYDIPPCVSLPQMAGKILRHHFFKGDEALQYPPPEAVAAAEFSYHAGKNGMYVSRGFYPDVYEYDINSAFPKAMREMPQLLKGHYKQLFRYTAKHMGVWSISGERLGGKYPIVFDHAFKPIKGMFDETWVTGYEMELLKNNPDYSYTVNEGWVWVPDKKATYSPLTAFVDRFWELKSTAPKGPKRDTYKNILNSLYGKFAACVEQRPTVDTEEGRQPYNGELVLGLKNGKVELLNKIVAPKRFLAGAMYHPFIATQITGYVRQVLYRLEKSGHAFHAATDSIKSKLDLPTSDALGGIKKEVYGGCFLFRNKLYLHFAKDASLCGHDLKKGWLYVGKRDEPDLVEVGDALQTGLTSFKQLEIDRRIGKVFHEGEHLCKFGLHGFKGSAFLLYAMRDELLANATFHYRYNHMVGLREGMKRGETVSDMVEREETLTLA